MDRQNIGQKKTNNDQHITTQKTGDELRCSGRVGIRLVMDEESVNTTQGTHPWSFVTDIRKRLTKSSLRPFALI
jgi:hypothetical protein